MKVKHRLWAAIGAVCLPSLAVAADDWQAISMVSNTLGVNTNRVCLGAPSTARESDMGCPADAPLWQNGGLAITGGVSATNVSVTANLTAAGATITNIGAGAIAANSLSSTLVSASNISATYVDATRNGTVSATYGYFGNIYGDGSGLTGVTAGSADWYDLTGIPTQVQAVSNSGAITLSGVSATNVSVTTNLTAAGATISSIGANAIAANSLSSTLVSASNISATYVDATRGGTVSATYGYFSQLSGTLPASMISGPITASSVAWGAITGTPATITSLTTTNLTTTSGIEAKDIIYFDGTNYDNVSATTLLGLGTMAYQNANSVAITGGTASLTGISATNVSVTTNLTAAGATISSIGANAIAANSLSSTLVSASNISATYVDATRNGTVSATYGYFSQLSGTLPASMISGPITASSVAWGAITGTPATITSLTTTNLTTTSGIAANEIIYFNGTDYDNTSATTLLGLGTMAYQNADSVAVTGGTASLTGISATNVSVTTNLTAAGATISSIGANAIAANSLSSTLVSASNISATYVDATRDGTVSATYGYFSQISGSGAGLYGIPAAAITGLSADRIVSDTTSIVANDVMDSISFTTAGSERMVVTSDGNVGIGTDTPQATLEVLANNDAYLPARFTRNFAGDATTSRGVINLYRGYASGPGATGIGSQIAFYAETSVDDAYEPVGVLKFYTSDATNGAVDSVFQVHNYVNSGYRIPLTILSDGNMGIGTTDPQTKLEVAGTVSSTGVSVTGVVTATEVKVASSGAGCTASAYGTIRYNSTDGVFEVCRE